MNITREGKHLGKVKTKKREKENWTQGCKRRRRMESESKGIEYFFVVPHPLHSSSQEAAGSERTVLQSLSSSLSFSLCAPCNREPDG